MSALGAKAGPFTRALRVPLLTVQPGAWHPQAPGDPADVQRVVGFYVLDGLLLRRVDLGGRVGAELLGSGDLLQPWLPQPPEETVRVACSWKVLCTARLAVLDARFEAVIARWPALATALIGAATRRSRMLAFQHAVCHYPALEDRLLALLWAFAERWGRVTPKGVVLPFRLTHAQLAEISGATRPSVSSALGQLGSKGAVLRYGKSWLLPAGRDRSTGPASDGGPLLSAA